MRIVIVGAAILGASTAFHLAGQRTHVTIIDAGLNGRATAAGAASARSAMGFVTRLSAAEAQHRFPRSATVPPASTSAAARVDGRRLAAALLRAAAAQGATLRRLLRRRLADDGHGGIDRNRWVVAGAGQKRLADRCRATLQACRNARASGLCPAAQQTADPGLASQHIREGQPAKFGPPIAFGYATA